MRKINWFKYGISLGLMNLSLAALLFLFELKGYANCILSILFFTIASFGSRETT